MSPIVDPTMVSTRSALVASGGDPDDFGSTTRPQGFVTPDFNIVVRNSKRGWTSSVQFLQAADEGSNRSLYLGPGLYSTDTMMMGGSRTTYYQGLGVRIYVEIDPPMAAVNRLAELEHCNDFRRAFKISLKAAQKAIKAARDRGPFGPFGKQRAAMAAARDALIQGLHPKLEKIFRYAIDVRWNVDRHRFRRDLGTLYEDLCKMSQPARDGMGYHTFVSELDHGSWSARSWAEYLGGKVLSETKRNSLFGEKKDIRRLVRGPNFKVPGPSSATVIHL